MASATTIRQQQNGNLYYADSNSPISPASSYGLNWTTPSSLHWLANYFSITPVTSTPPNFATTTITYDLNGNATAVGTTSTYTYDYLNRLQASTVGNGLSPTTTLYGNDYVRKRT